MSDVTMCHDSCCPVREHCRRSAASGTVPDPHGRQSWFMASPRTLAGCGLFEPERSGVALPLHLAEFAMPGRA